MDAFISYSRKDKDFVQKIHDALLAHDKALWVDWKDIPLTADWWAEIGAGIEATHAFVFIISPDSVSSKVCNQEIDYAVNHNKRLIPIVYREAANIPYALSHLNWIFCQEADDFEAAFEKLLEVMDTDLEWAKRHTYLTREAVAWQQNGRNDSYLLRGDNLAEAAQHLSQPERQPTLTALQQEYIVAGQQQQASDLHHELEQATILAATEQRRLAEQQQHYVQLRRRSRVVIGSLLLVIVVGIVGIFRYGALRNDAQYVIEMVIEVADAETNHAFCRSGTLRGLTDIVLQACTHAIELDPSNPAYYESRAVAYGILDELSAARVDLQTALELALELGGDEAQISKWETWISEIDQGFAPFGPERLDQLRDEWRVEYEAED